MVAERDVARHRQIERHVSSGVGAKRISVDDAPQLDLARLVRRDTVRQQLLEAASADAFYNVILDAEAR